MPMCMNYVTILYMVVTLPNVCGEIGVNCGPGAVVGKPYRMECTNIPATVTNGINVFLGDTSNSIVSCSPTKNCAPRNSLLYSVTTPHTTSLSFTILNVTTDDIGKKLYCVDDTTLDLSTPSCTIIVVGQVTESTTSRTDNQPNPEIGVNCGPGAVVGKPYNLECTNIPATVTNGIHVFLGDNNKGNCIIVCFLSKTCASKSSSLYSVTSPHNESLYFTILSVTTDDIGKNLYCVDDRTLDLTSPKPSCTINSSPDNSVASPTTTNSSPDNSVASPTTTNDDGVLSDGATAGIVIGSAIAVTGSIVTGVVCTCIQRKKKKNIKELISGQK